MENRQKNGRISVEASANVKVMWTYGNESDCTFFKTKKEAKEHRKENFGSLYASEAEMDRLLPIYKVMVGNSGLENGIAIGENRANEQQVENFRNELEQAIGNCIYCVESAKGGISMDLAKDIKETYESFNNRWINMTDNYYSNMPISKLLIEFNLFEMYVCNIAEVIANTNKSIEKLYDMLEEE